MYKGERLNGATHLAGLALAVTASGALISRAAELNVDTRQIVGCAVFAASMIAVYASSVLFHCSRGRRKALWAKADHCAIYLLIAGTYTPFTLIGLRGPWGWGLFAAIWTLALGGVVFKLFYTGRFKRLSTAIYIAMGWLVIVAIEPMWNSLDGFTLGWLLAGGVSYTLGTYFYHRESVRYSHAIWHLFVIGGSVCHFVSVTAQIL